jgi:hypothetical protein
MTTLRCCDVGVFGSLVCLFVCLAFCFYFLFSVDLSLSLLHSSPFIPGPTGKKCVCMYV